MEPEPEYLSIEQAARYLGVTPAQVRRILRQYGLGEFTRASMSKQVTIRRADLDQLGAAVRGAQGAPAPRQASARRRRSG